MSRGSGVMSRGTGGGGGGGAVIQEGFLCPICMADLGDVAMLQLHFEVKHAKEDPAFVQNLKDLFGKAKKMFSDSDGPTTGGGSGGAGGGGYGGTADEAVANVISDLTKESGVSSGALAALLGGGAPKDHDPVSGIHNRFLFDDYHGEPVQITKHFDYFRSERSKRVDRIAMDTNKIIIRLDKLLRKLPTDPVKRKMHEQNVVPWMPETAVPLCPDCGRPFNLTRRKHHCRLCGSVLCDECSTTVAFEFARKVINPVTISKYSSSAGGSGSDSVWTPAAGDDSSNPVADHSDGGSSGGGGDARSVGSRTAKNAGGIFKIRRSRSKESLRSFVDLQINDQHFRSCRFCECALRKRDDSIEQAVSKPILVQFYSRLRSHMDEGHELSVEYRKMAASLNAGETDYHLADAKHVRMKLLKIAENVDLMSRKIAALGVDSTAPPESQPTGSELTLQHRIRMAAVNFVKEDLVGLPSVPSEDEYDRLKAARTAEAARRVEEEKRQAKVAKIKFEQDNIRRTRASPQTNANSTPAAAVGKSVAAGARRKERSGKAVEFADGFVLSASDAAAAIAAGTASDDPMVQQMNIIRGYIQQAREANRYDEVRMLEANLKELRVEWRRMQEERRRERVELEENYNEYVDILGGGAASAAADAEPYADATVNNSSAAEGANPFAEGDEDVNGGDNDEKSADDNEDSSSSFAVVNQSASSETDEALDEYDASGKNPFL